MNEFMQEAILEAYQNSHNNFKDGGPFGAVIVKDNKIISKAHNTVLKDKDATCHAEVNAIKEASKKLGTHDLEGCILYTNCYPCPMCLSASIWANIKEIYYVATKEQVGKIGFRDDYIYDFFKGKNEPIKLNRIEDNNMDKLFEEFMQHRNLY